MKRNLVREYLFPYYNAETETYFWVLKPSAILIDTRDIKESLKWKQEHLDHLGIKNKIINYLDWERDREEREMFRAQA